MDKKHAIFDTYDIVEEIDHPNVDYIVLDYDIKKRNGVPEVTYELICDGRSYRLWESELRKIGHYETPLKLNEVVIAIPPDPETGRPERSKGVVTGISGEPGQSHPWGFTVRFDDDTSEYFEQTDLVGTGRIIREALSNKLAT